MAWREQSVGSQRDPEMDEDADQPAHGDRLLQAFRSRVLLPLMGLSATAPEEARQQIERIREQLDALTRLIGDAEPAPASAHAAGSNGTAVASGAAAATPPADDIGRNQRSRVREMLLLDTLASEKRAFPLAQLSKALEANGINGTPAAVVSQLHRLKNLRVIDQPTNGMYEITPDGLVHLRQLRHSFGPLLRR